MSKKNLLYKKFIKLVLPITKIIESFFNFFVNWKSNKKKYFNLWRKSLEKKTFIVSGVLFITVITYFLLPAFYNENKIKAQLENHISKKYNLEVKLDKNPKYSLLPKPHFLAKDVKIQYDSKTISNSQNIQFFISSKNNLEINKIKIQNLIFKNTEFKINKKNFRFFTNLLNNKSADQDIEFIKSKLFYIDQDENVIFFSNIKKLDYSFQQNLLNEMKSKLEIFNLPIKLKTKHDTIKKNIFTEIYLNSLKLKIKNNLDYNQNGLNGELSFNYINNDKSIKYNLKNKNLTFNTEDKKLTGEINIKPFFLLSNLDLQNIRVKEIYKNDSIIINLLKSEILNNKNLNGKLSVSINSLNDLRNIGVIKFDIQFEEGSIFISNLNFLFKGTKFNFDDVSLVVDNNQLKFIGDMIIDFKDMEDFYSHFQIKRNYRKNIDRINSSFVFNFDDKLFELNELKIKGIDKQILVKFLNSFNSKEKDFFNKVTIRNTVRDFFRIISSG